MCPGPSLGLSTRYFTMSSRPNAIANDSGMAPCRSMASTSAAGSCRHNIFAMVALP